MKLTELNPRWIVSGDRRVGLTFDCPHCFSIPDIQDTDIAKIGVYFKNPIGGGLPIETKYLWNRKGDTFETMTLSPSVNASKAGQPLETITIRGKGHWHGWITNGEITTHGATF